MQDSPRVLQTLGSGIICLVCLATNMNIAHVTSSAFAARSAAFCILVASSWSSGSRFLCWLGFFIHFGVLAGRNRRRLSEASRAGTFAQIPPHVIGAQAMLDYCRTTAGSFVWRTFILIFQSLITNMLPLELRTYGCEIPFFQLGADADLGGLRRTPSRWSRGRKVGRHNLAILFVMSGR